MTRPLRDRHAPLATAKLALDRAVAVSPHHLASAAAVATMHRGGTAVDGAIAADAVLSVVAPDTCGIGGDLFALVHVPGSDAPQVLNASGRAGSGTTAARLRAAGLTEIPIRSRHSITVPGCVDGWMSLHERFGALALRDDFAPAIGHAEDGFPVSVELASSLSRMHAPLAGQASAAALYPGGEPPRPGETLWRRALADTIRVIAAGGRDAFYDGPPGAAIVAATEGGITHDDLTRQQADWVEPISVEVFGRTGWTVPPNSQGYLTLAGLWIFEQLDPPRDPSDPGYQHALIESYRAVAWERADLVADPDRAPLAQELLLSRDRLASRVGAISLDATATWPQVTQAPGGTAYLCVRDGDGMAVSFIQSNFWGIGSGISAGATGVWLHNRGAGFTLEPGHPNELTPGARPLHTLAPTLWTDQGELRLLLGTRGGDQQPQFLMQSAAHQLWAGLCPEDAQAFPRWRMDDFGPGAGSHLAYEPRFSKRTVRGLAERGHALAAADAEWEPGWGPVSIIESGNHVLGAADPRVTTAAALSD